MDKSGKFSFHISDNFINHILSLETSWNNILDTWTNVVAPVQAPRRIGPSAALLTGERDDGHLGQPPLEERVYCDQQVI